jgi:hypothetical protein
MALIAETPTPKSLLRMIRAKIDSGGIATWEYDRDGDFTHKASQWHRRAWFRPRIVERSRLILNILAPQGKQLNKVVYAVYHSEFLQLLLVHFDQRFTTARATALPTANDRVVG